MASLPPLPAHLHVRPKLLLLLGRLQLKVLLHKLVVITRRPLARHILAGVPLRRPLHARPAAHGARCGCVRERGTRMSRHAGCMPMQMAEACVCVCVGAAPAGGAGWQQRNGGWRQQQVGVT